MEREIKMKIFELISSVMADINAITKSQTNTQQGFKFRGVDQFINVIHPILVKHKLVIIPRCIEEAHEIRTVTRSNGKQGTDKHVSLKMEYDFLAPDGSKVTVGPIPAEGLDSGDKATNKALSAAFKYMCIQTFWVPTEDIEDGDKDSPEIAASEPLPDFPEGGQKFEQSDKKEYQDNQHSTALVTEAQVKRLFAIAKKHNWSNDKVKEFMKVRYQIESTKDLNRFNYDHLVAQIEATK